MSLSGKVVFITGGAGFIGTHFIRRIVQDNQIWVWDAMVRNALGGAQLEGHPNLSVSRGDVLDREGLKAAIPREVDIVVHAAAIAGIDTVVKNQVRTLEVNTIGTYNILRALAELGLVQRVQRFINFSTSEVFGTRVFRASEDQPTEMQPVGEPRWTYAVGKLAAEHLVQGYHKDFGLRTVCLRPFNVYGPGQIGEGAIHGFVVRALRDEPLVIRGDGEQIRSWCYVDDMVEGLLLALTKDAAIGEVFNIGNPGATLTISSLAELIVQLAGSNSPIVHQPQNGVDVDLRVPSIAKAKRLLGFEPTVSLAEGIRRTLAWYRENPS